MYNIALEKQSLKSVAFCIFLYKTQNWLKSFPFSCRWFDCWST